MPKISTIKLNKMRKNYTEKHFGSLCLFGMSITAFLTLAMAYFVAFYKAEIVDTTLVVSRFRFLRVGSRISTRKDTTEEI